MFVGWLLTASSTIVWVGKGIYDLVRTDQEFLTILEHDKLLQPI